MCTRCLFRVGLLLLLVGGVALGQTQDAPTPSAKAQESGPPPSDFDPDVADKFNKALIDLGQPGVVVRIFEVGESMHALPELPEGQLPNAARVYRTVDLDGARADFQPARDQFVTEVTGYIKVSTAGRYVLRLISDDGARLWVNNRLIIDHDGLHGPDPRNGEVDLVAGNNPFHILHFDAGGGERLALMWKVRGKGEGDEAYGIIPAALLRHDPEASLATAPGKKRIIQPLRRGRPGDGAPLVGIHPSYKLMALGLEDDDEELVPILRNLRTSARVGACLAPTRKLIKSVTVGRGLAQLRHVLGREVENPGALAVWMPPGPEASQPSTPCLVRTGTYAKQLLVGDARTGSIWRVCLDGPDLQQGCVFRFSGSESEEIYSLMSEPDGSIVLGEEWLKVPVNVGVPLRALVPTAEPTFEMLAARMLANGLEIEFTQPLDERVGWDTESYLIEQWPFDLDGGASPRRDGTTTPVKSASVSADRRRVFLEIEGFQPPCLVYVRLLPPCLSEGGQLPWSTEAWYTLLQISTDAVGEVLTPPARPARNVLSDEEQAAGWKLLFDGKTTQGWRGYRKESCPPGWQVKDGCLVRMGPGGDIITDEQFDNFELALEWRICAGGNSGIFYRVNEELDWPFFTGPEMQVLDNAEHADGGNPKTSAGSNYGLYAPVRDVTQPVGLFNKVRIVVNGAHVEHWLNDEKIVEYELWSDEWKELIAGSKFTAWPKYGLMKKGHIVLQDHGDQVWYRNIKIRELSGE
ncbi:MAG: family 16 glycoside hydrolase [Planctomycetota bacterium]